MKTSGSCDARIRFAEHLHIEAIADFTTLSLAISTVTSGHLVQKFRVAPLRKRLVHPPSLCAGKRCRL